MSAKNMMNTTRPKKIINNAHNNQCGPPTQKAHNLETSTSIMNYHKKSTPKQNIRIIIITLPDLKNTNCTECQTQIFTCGPLNHKPLELRTQINISNIPPDPQVKILQYKAIKLKILTLWHH